MLLDYSNFEHYIDSFNKNDEENIKQYIDNSSVWPWMRENIPFFECPDREIEETYYFRWWTYRKHIKQTPAGFIITEFLPDVSWAGRYNSIVCPSGHHIYEGRWVHDRKYIDEYALFWYRKGGDLRAYSSWLGYAVWQYCKVSGDFSLAVELLDDFLKDYREWERSNLHESGLFWSIDDRDGGEFSISGSGLRPTLNSYMYGYAAVIAKTARLAGREDVCGEFENKASALKRLINEKLWDKKDGYFKVIPMDSRNGILANQPFSSIDSGNSVHQLQPYKLKLSFPFLRKRSPAL